ncbi:GroES-like protein [Panus rudis PR-1116 ss-1]|nr:GroES-like protein [Panus rudis PR-1116 ss-1]
MSTGIPKTQRAFVLPEKAGKFVLQTIEVPKPGEGEVLIRIESTGLNPLDAKMQDYGLLLEKYPVIIGFDLAGVVVELGKDVQNLVVGDRVAVEAAAMDDRYTAYQQYAVSPADLAFKVPKNISFDEAATLPVGFATALAGLYGDFTPDQERYGAGLTPFWREGGRTKYNGEPIAILSAASSVGQYAVQFARLSGFSPIIATASLHNTELLKSIGATHVIDRTLPIPQNTEEVRKITSKPFKVVYDAVGLPHTQESGFEILAPGGTLLTTLPSGIDKAKAAAEKKNLSFVFGQLSVPPYRQLAHESSPIVPKLLESGELKTNIPEYIPGGLLGIPEGLERFRQNKVSGRKLVVRPPETK